MEELWGIIVQYCPNMRNYGELCGIMGSYGEIAHNYRELWWNCGEFCMLFPARGIPSAPVVVNAR